MSAAKRKELEEAISTLEAQRRVLGDAVVDASVAALRQQLDSLKPSPQQRKLVTVLFMDIVGSTTMVRDLDPEDNLAIMDGALQQMTLCIEAYGGQVTRFMGDGFMAVFGYAVAKESDPERAVQAGLAILKTAGEYAKQVRLQWHITSFNVRVGINTGLVVIGGYSEDSETIAGKAINLAARLESAASPGAILISHGTYQHIRGVFEVELMDPILAKGFPEPVPVYRVKREKPRAFRMGRRGVEGLETKTIGREMKLKTLQAAFLDSVKQEKTTVITLVGEAGVGKSRLVYELNNWLELQPESIWYFKGRASQQTQGSPQYLLRDMLAGRFQILDSDPLTELRKKFVAGVCAFLPDEGEIKAHILGTWLGYDFGDSPYLQAIRDEPEQIKNRATLYLAQFFTAVAEQNPTVVLLDDIHWADGNSLDAVIDLMRRRPELPLFAVCSARPSLYERRPEWGESMPTHIRLDLEPLSNQDTKLLVAEILRQVDDLPQILLDLVSNRAEGNPFYAEELVKMLIDEGVILTGAETWQVVPEQLVALQIPDTLTEVLQARLDKLQPKDRQAIQQASVIGRIFWDKALGALHADGPQAIPSLQAKEFIYPRGESAFMGTAEYIFKHALLRDVTYETVLKRVRRQYHALVADWLAATAESNKRGEEYAVLIGEHYQLADNPGQAAHWYGRAGEQAVRTYAHQDAVHYLSLALKLTPDDDVAAYFALLEVREKAFHMQGDREAQRKDLSQLAALAGRMGNFAQAKAALRQASYALATSDYPTVMIHAQDALEWAQRGGHLALAAEGYWVWGMAYRGQGQYHSAQEQLKTGLHLAQKVGDLKQVNNCLVGLGSVGIDQGDYAAARQHLEQALAIAREIGDRREEGVNLNVLGLLGFNLGNYTAAREYYEQALVISRETGDRRGEASSLNNLGIVAEQRRDYAAAKKCYEASLAISQEIGNRYGEASNLNNLGFSALNLGDYSAARRHFEQTLAISREIGDRKFEGVVLVNLGHLASYQGRVDAATGYYEQALAIQREIGDRWGEGISLNELGALALEQDDLPRAESCYQQGLAVRQELIQPQYIVEDWAGLAKLKLAQNDREAARAHGQEILEYCREHPRLEGAEKPMRTFHFTWEVLVALGETAAADEVLALSIRIIQDYLDKNPDPNIQAMYLRQRHHAMLWEAWRDKQR